MPFLRASARVIILTAVVTAAAGVAAAGAPELALISSLDARDELLSSGAEADAAGSAAQHNPALSMFASLAVPGTGQLVLGEKRGYLYLLAEAALWGGVLALDSKGTDKRDEYEAYADAHWDFNGYSDWYAETCVDCDDCDEYLCRPLAEYGTQEYYEDIGKYDTYWRWWNDDGDETYIDWREYSDADVTFRDAYYDMRGESNRYLRHARYAMMAAFLNHVVSSVDAFLSARGGGRAAAAAPELDLEFDVADGGSGLSCAVVARY